MNTSSNLFNTFKKIFSDHDAVMSDSDIKDIILHNPIQLKTSTSDKVTRGDPYELLDKSNKSGRFIVQVPPNNNVLLQELTSVQANMGYLLYCRYLTNMNKTL